MNNEMTFRVAPTLKAPTAAIAQVEPKFLTDGSKCEANANAWAIADEKILDEGQQRNFSDRPNQ